MRLVDIGLNKEVKVLSINVLDEKLKIRLKELGLYNNASVKLLKFSPLKKTVLIEILDTTFAIKTCIAKNIIVC